MIKALHAFWCRCFFTNQEKTSIGDVSSLQPSIPPLHSSFWKKTFYNPGSPRGSLQCLACCSYVVQSGLVLVLLFFFILFYFLTTGLKVLPTLGCLLGLFNWYRKFCQIFTWIFPASHFTLCHISVWMFTACAMWLLITIAGISLVKLETSTLHQINVLGKSLLVGKLLYIAYYSDFL